MFIETKMFLFVGALILHMETVKSCGESGRLIIVNISEKFQKCSRISTFQTDIISHFHGIL